MRRMEVYILMSHLLITVLVLGSYVYLQAVGVVDETLKNLLLIIGGYWFGAFGADKVKGAFSGKKKGE